MQSQGTREETPSTGAWSREPAIHQGRGQTSQTSYDYGYQDLLSLQGSELRLATITNQVHTNMHQLYDTYKYAPIVQKYSSLDICLYAEVVWVNRRRF